MEKDPATNFESLTVQSLSVQIQGITNFNKKTKKITKQYQAEIEKLRKEKKVLEDEIEVLFNTLEI